MSNYWKLQRSSSDCIHFVYADQVDDSDSAITDELRKSNVKWVYVDYLDVKHSDQHIADVIAYLLKLQHAPYGPRTSPYQPKIWVPFLDDLVGLSRQEHENGVAIIIDSADVFLAENGREFFELIEAFLIQFSDWFEKKKPCHLCFQMEKSEWVRRIFASP